MSGPESPASEALRWLRYAGADLRTARALLGQAEAPPHHACLHSQQAAEKALKALLRASGIGFPPIHDLEELLNLLPAASALGTSRPDLYRLTAWHIEARYPGPWAEPGTEDAERAVAAARAIYDHVADEFRRRGANVE